MVTKHTNQRGKSWCSLDPELKSPLSVPGGSRGRGMMAVVWWEPAGGCLERSQRQRPKESQRWRQKVWRETREAVECDPLVEREQEVSAGAGLRRRGCPPLAAGPSLRISPSRLPARLARSLSITRLAPPKRCLHGTPTPAWHPYPAALSASSPRKLPLRD